MAPQIQQLGRIAGSGAYAAGNGSGVAIDVSRPMSIACRATITAPRRSAVVWDAGNGAAGPAMAALADRLPGRHNCLFAEVDGHFPEPPSRPDRA